MAVNPMQRYPLWLKTLLVVLGVHAAYVYIAMLSNHTSSHRPLSYVSNDNGPEPNSAEAAVPLVERRVNAIVTQYDAVLKARLDELIARKAGARDPDVIALVQALMDPPSDHMVKTSRKIVTTPQSKAVSKVLHNKKNGFFIECGALDGERSSNTMALEQQDGWRGVLIEMDPYFYTQLRGKNRKSPSINACLSPYDYPIEMEFKESSGGLGKLLDKTKARGKGGTKVPCFPLESILLALKITHVDFFSLDVEGFELEVLKTIPFDRLDISTLAVEYAHGRSGKQSYLEFMGSQGYVSHADIHFHDERIGLYVDDFIFVKKELMK